MSNGGQGPAGHGAGVTRREMIRLTGLDLFGLSMASWLWAGSSAGVRAAETELATLNRFPRMVQGYFVRRVREAEARAAAARAELKTKADAEAYVESVRARIRESFGPWPERTPLEARVTGVVDRDAYRVEKVIFQSRPGFLVTANFYVPKGRSFPLPGVVGTCGHSTNGKCAEAYQSFAQGLARLGFVVLIYDPIGQGERLQYPDENARSRVGPGVREHLLAGNQQFLVGEFFGTWRAWDGIRALDYLLTREEVDPQRVGVTGNSGGGTMTTWLCGTESRWAMAAPSCFVTTFRRNMENELPADTEQCPPRALALGLDHADFLAALAPKPIIILAKERDYFDVRGTQEAFARLKRLYGLLGAEEKIALFIGPTYHGYSQENREAMYRWFLRSAGIDGEGSEPALVIEKDETLWCTPRGQVAPLGSKPVYAFTQAQAQAVARSRPRLDGEELIGAVRRRLKLPTRPTSPDFRILRPLPSRRHPKRYTISYAVQSEPRVHALVYLLYDERLYSRPPRDKTRAVLYVSHHSADAELRDEPLVRELYEAEPESQWFACDVRGVGESRPNTCGQDTFLEPYGCDYFYAIHAIMLDDPYLAQKTRDLLAVIHWLVHAGYPQVHLAGMGWGALPATFAALVADPVVQVTLKHALTSYGDIAASVQYAWPLSCLLPGVLESFDLPDCYRALAAKGLRQIEPWGPDAKPA